MKKVLFMFFAIALNLVAACSVWADGGGPLRKTTAEEKKYYLNIRETAALSMPAAPEGWSVSTCEIGTLDEVGEGSEKSPLVVSYSIQYSRAVSDTEENEGSKAAAAIMDAKKPKIEALSKKQEALSEKIAEAIKSNNAAEVEKLQKDMEALAKEAESMSAQLENETRNSKFGDYMKSRNVHINVIVNGSEIYMETPSELPKVAGKFVALREGAKKDDAFDDEVMTVVLMGEWDIKKDSCPITARMDKGASHVKARNLAVHIAASAEAADKFIKIIDFNKLADILK